MFYNDADDNYNSCLVLASISQQIKHPRDGMEAAFFAAAAASTSSVGIIYITFPFRALKPLLFLKSNLQRGGCGLMCCLVALEHEAVPVMDMCRLRRNQVSTVRLA